MEKLERMAVGDRPRWLVEIDRFYRTQLGGADPIHMWLTIPLMYFEPPAMCVRRFWRGFHRLIEESPGHRIVAATHSGPIRAFATWAHGYDPGEPYNTEEVVVKVRRGGRTALVAYRNRVTEVNVPPPDEFPAWES
jgi:broad specificity phosphatase PhoE